MEPEKQPATKPVKKCKCAPIIIILAVLALSGLGFGGFILWQSTQNHQTDDSSETILSIDKGNQLGEKLFEQIKSVTATDFCGTVAYPLYEGGFVIKPETVSRSNKFEIIAKRVPEIASLESGEEVTISGEKLEEAFDSVFGDYGDIDYSVFDFSDLDSGDGTQSVQLDDYTITKIDDEKYLISYVNSPKPLCELERFSDNYEYVGLSNTIDGQPTINVDENTQMSLIVLEKKTIDRATDNYEAKSNGYYGALFTKRQDSEQYYWLGTYYLGNTIEK